MAFKDDFQSVLRCEPASLYEAFVQLAKKALPPATDVDARYQYLRSPQGKFIARDEADVNVYTVRVAQRHIPKFKWLYKELFREYSEVFNKDIDLVVWGCGCGLDLLALYDQARSQKNPHLWTKVRHVTLVDVSEAALVRAKQITEMLFPLAEVIVVQCNLLNSAQIERKVVLRRLTAYLPRIHLMSNLLDLFDDVRPFAEAVRKCSVRNLWSSQNDKIEKYYNELVVAFSPEYQNGMVALKIAKFRRAWNSCYSKDVQTIGSGPDNCEFCAFSCSTLAGLRDPCYQSYLRGENNVLNMMVAKCSEVESGFDFCKFVTTLDEQRVFGKSFFEVYRWVEVSRYKGCIDRFIFAPDPKLVPRPAPCVVEWVPGCEDQKNQLVAAADRALYDLKKRRGDECVAIGGKEKDVVVLCWDGKALTYWDRESREILALEERDSDEGLTTECHEFLDKFWACDGVVDYSLYFRIDPGDAEPLPVLDRCMDEKQCGVIYSRAQYRKIRGDAGCGKSTTMMWHAVFSVLRTHLPVLLVCKTVTLFSRNSKRMAATLLNQIPELEYVDSDLIQFMTLDKVLCDHIKVHGQGCLWKQCSRCEKKNTCTSAPVFNCREFLKMNNRECHQLNDNEKNTCCDACVAENISRLSRKGTPYALKSKKYGAVMIDEIQSVNPSLVQAVVNLTYGGNPARECYVFCDERQCLNPEAVEIDPEKGKLRVKVPDHGDGYGHWVDLKIPYRTSLDFTGKLTEVAVKLQKLTAEKYGAVELAKFVGSGQMELSSRTVFSVKRSTDALMDELQREIFILRRLGADSVTIICDDVDDVRRLLRCPKAQGWRSTHLQAKSHVEEQRLRMTFCEKTGGVQLTTVTLAQGWDFKSVIYVCTSDGCGRNVFENALTGVTRATSFMRVLDRSPSGWLYEILKEVAD